MYVNTIIPELKAIISLNRTTVDIATVLERLSTGLRINSAKDDPSGIVVRDQLRSQIKGIESALKNTDATSSVLATADKGLGNISNQLTDLRGLLTSSTTSQAEIDSVLDAIDYIARSTIAPNGKAIINGALDYTTAGVNRNQVDQLHITSADLTKGAAAVNIQVKEAAKQGTLTLNQAGVSNDTLLTVAGNLGQATLSLTPSMSTQDIINAVNSLTSSTGVKAKVEWGDVNEQLQISSVGTDNDIVLTAIGNESNVVKISAAPAGATEISVDFSTPGTVNILLPQGVAKPASAETDAAKLGILTKDFQYATNPGDTITLATTSGVNVASVILDNTAASGSGVSVDLTGGVLTISYENGVSTSSDIAAKINADLSGLTATYATNLTATNTGTLTPDDLRGDDQIIVTSTTDGPAANGTNVVYVLDSTQGGGGEFRYVNSAREASTVFDNGSGGTLTFTASGGGSANNGVAINFVQDGNPLSTAYSASNRTLTISGDLANVSVADLNTALAATDIDDNTLSAAADGITNLWGTLDGTSKSVGSTADTVGLDAAAFVIGVGTYTSAGSLVGSYDNSLPFTLSNGPGGGTGSIFLSEDAVNGTATRVYSGSNSLSGGTDGSGSGTTAKELIDYINGSTSGLGELFTASLAPGDGGTGTGSGYVSFFDTAADYGNTESGSGLQFLGSSGGAAQNVVLCGTGLNQQLATVLNTTTKTLGVQLATNAQGTVTTTARDLVDYFRTLSTAQTGGVSVSVLRPVGETYDPPTDGNSGTGVVSATTSPIALTATEKKIGEHTFGNTKIVFETVNMGSSQFVSVTSDQTLPIVNDQGKTASRSDGADMVASVNGMYASAQGNALRFSGPMFSLDAVLADSVKSGDTVKFTITGGGGTFQLGQNVVSSQQLRLGIPSVSTWNLGGSSGRLGDLRAGGKADLATNRDLAAQILEEAFSDLSSTRTRIGSIQKDLVSVNKTSLEDQLLITVGAEENISATDYAAETSRLTRLNILAESQIDVIYFARQYAQYALAFF